MFPNIHISAFLSFPLKQQEKSAKAQIQQWPEALGTCGEWSKAGLRSSATAAVTAVMMMMISGQV